MAHSYTHFTHTLCPIESLPCLRALVVTRRDCVLAAGLLLLLHTIRNNKNSAPHSTSKSVYTRGILRSRRRTPDPFNPTRPPVRSSVRRQPSTTTELHTPQPPLQQLPHTLTHDIRMCPKTFLTRSRPTYRVVNKIIPHLRKLFRFLFTKRLLSLISIRGFNRARIDWHHLPILDGGHVYYLKRIAREGLLSCVPMVIGYILDPPSLPPFLQ